MDSSILTHNTIFSLTCTFIIFLIFLSCQPKQENGGVSDAWPPPKLGFDNLGFVPGSPCEMCPQARGLCCGARDSAVGRDTQVLTPPVKSALVRIRVEGMTCQSCVQSIEGRIGELPGVMAIQVYLSDKEASVTFNPGQVGPEELRTHIEDMGFDAILTSSPILTSSHGRKLEVNAAAGEVAMTLGVEGMHCGSCVHNIQEHVSGLLGVCSVSVSLETRHMDLKYDPSLVTLEMVKGLVEGIPPGNFHVTLPTLPVETPAAIWTTSSMEMTPSSQHLNSASTSQTSDSVPFPAATIGILGMTCNSCVQSIEGMISQRPGVQSIRVSLKKEKGMVIFNPTLTSAEELREAIEDMGFEATLEKGIVHTIICSVHSLAH